MYRLASYGSQAALRPYTPLIVCRSPAEVDGVWTSGSRSQYDFYWGLGEPVSYSGFKGWSRTGAIGHGQPDNAGGDEHCLAVLNNAFGDGITWHDVACHRRMSFVCEPRADD